MLTHVPGTTDGQTKIVREGDNGVAYSWNMKEYKWDKVLLSSLLCPILIPKYRLDKITRVLELLQDHLLGWWKGEFYLGNENVEVFIWYTEILDFTLYDHFCLLLLI